MSGQRPTIGAQLTVAAIFAVLGIAALYWFVTFAERTERQPRTPYRQDYSEKELDDALTATNLEKRIRQIAAAGHAEGERQEGRLSGSPGFYRSEELIKSAVRAAGLRVSTQ